MYKSLIAVVLAAGRGRRLNAKKINKSLYTLAGKPMIGYTVDLLKKVDFKNIVFVVGYAKKSVINYLGHGYIFAEQKKRLGTAHAVKVALAKIPKNIKTILVINADDSAFYPKRVIKGLINSHLDKKADLSFLTVDMKNPNIARVIRDKNNKVLGIIEQQNLKQSQKKIKEINCGCYCFSISFLKRYLSKVKKNNVSNEYYITELIEIGARNNCRLNAYKMNKEDYFCGVNTKSQLIEADLKMKNKLKSI